MEEIEKIEIMLDQCDQVMSQINLLRDNLLKLLHSVDLEHNNSGPCNRHSRSDTSNSNGTDTSDSNGSVSQRDHSHSDDSQSDDSQSEGSHSDESYSENSADNSENDQDDSYDSY